MKKQTKTAAFTAVCLLLAFALWTVAVQRWDVKPIGPENSVVGFSALNGGFHKFTGVHMALYYITDWLGLVPLSVAASFAALGLSQWIKQKRLKQVDRSLFILGGFYVAVMALFLLFESLAINYRPVLIEGRLEASYPSSTTLLVMCVMPTAAMQLRERMANVPLRQCLTWGIAVFTIFMVAARLFSGVHWLTDIVGGGFLSAGLVMLYGALCDIGHN